MTMPESTMCCVASQLWPLVKEMLRILLSESETRAQMLMSLRQLVEGESAAERAREAEEAIGKATAGAKRAVAGGETRAEAPAAKRQRGLRKAKQPLRLSQMLGVAEPPDAPPLPSPALSADSAPDASASDGDPPADRPDVPADPSSSSLMITALSLWQQLMLGGAKSAAAAESTLKTDADVSSGTEPAPLDLTLGRVDRPTSEPADKAAEVRVFSPLATKAKPNGGRAAKPKARAATGSLSPAKPAPTSPGGERASSPSALQGLVEGLISGFSIPKSIDVGDVQLCEDRNGATMLQYRCPFCERKVIVTRDCPNTHVCIYKDPATTYCVCSCCEQRFKHYSNARRHAKYVHLKTYRPYHCDHCGRKFLHPYELRNHGDVCPYRANADATCFDNKIDVVA